jgi:hypothetical protein
MWLCNEIHISAMLPWGYYFITTTVHDDGVKEARERPIDKGGGRDRLHSAYHHLRWVSPWIRDNPEYPDYGPHFEKTMYSSQSSKMSLVCIRGSYEPPPHLIKLESTLYLIQKKKEIPTSVKNAGYNPCHILLLGCCNAVENRKARKRPSPRSSHFTCCWKYPQFTTEAPALRVRFSLLCNLKNWLLR